MTAARASTREGELIWRLFVAALVILATAAPFAFGLPVIGKGTCLDGNFALEMTNGYLGALRGGIWIPHWLPAANAGLGSPAFYFYGRLPFLVAAVLGITLHLGAVGALIAGFVVFRLIAFFTCRTWLAASYGKRAADGGALAFVALPFAMSFNPITRVGFAETAATAFIPLLFLVLDAVLACRRRILWAVPAMAVLYATIAVLHPLQVVLAFAVTLLYVLVWRNRWAVLANLLGLILGILLGSASWLPALAMQGMISSAAWTNNFFIDLWNNFLFTTIRYRVWGFYDQDIWLYANWLLCTAVLVVCVRRGGMAWHHQAPRQRVLAICLGIVLIAVTGVARPFWLIVHSLRIIQFPWRLFPCGVALTGALAAGWAGVNRRRQWKLLFFVSAMMAGQLFVVGLGGYVWLRNVRNQHRIPSALLVRLPAFVPKEERMLPAYAKKRNDVAEYIPAGARAAGWHLDPQSERLVPGELVQAVPPVPQGLHVTAQGNGTFTVSGELTTNQTVILPEFYFPDEAASGGLSARVSLDASTGLAKLEIPAGPVALSVNHDGELAPVRNGRVLSALGVCVLMLWTILAFLIERRLRRPDKASQQSRLRFSSEATANARQITT